MRKIYLFCSAGMSTSLLVSRMQEAAKKINYECEVAAFAVSKVNTLGREADFILLGPQISFDLKNTQKVFPNKPVEVIAMRDYGLMNGENVIKHVKEVLGD